MSEKDKNIGHKIKELRKTLGFTRSAFEQEFGISRNTLKSIEYGVYKPNKNQSTILSNAFRSIGINVDPEFFLSDELSEHLSDNDFVISFSQEIDIEKEINLVKKQSPELVFVKMLGNEMCPFLNPGDVVAGIPAAKDKWNQLEGKICIIENDMQIKCVRVVCYINEETDQAHCKTSNQQQENYKKIEKINLIKISPVSRHWIVSNLIK